MNNRIIELESIIKLADEQKSIGEIEYFVYNPSTRFDFVDHQKMGISSDIHLPEGTKLYIHPDFKSAMRIKELENEVKSLKKLLGK